MYVADSTVKLAVTVVSLIATQLPRRVQSHMETFRSNTVSHIIIYTRVPVDRFSIHYLCINIRGTRLCNLTPALMPDTCISESCNYWEVHINVEALHR